MGKDSTKGFTVVTISEEYMSLLQKRDAEVKDTVKDKKLVLMLVFYLL